MGTGPSGAKGDGTSKPIPKLKLVLALVTAVVALAVRAYLESDAGSNVPIEVLAVPVLLLGLAALGFGLFSSERLLMHGVTRRRRWHSPRALRVVCVTCGALFSLLGVSGFLFG